MFQLTTTTAVKCVNANPRREFHGEESHRAIDLTFEYDASTDQLDLIAPGLCRHHYCNRAAEAGQGDFADGDRYLPNLRFPQLPTEVRWNQVKARGYRWVWDWGREEEHVNLEDAALAALSYSLREGGLTIKFTVSYNGESIEDNALYGELCGLPSTGGEVHVQLHAPVEVIPVKKGWRSGKIDEPQTVDGGGQLFVPPDDDTDDDVVHPEGTPEAALAASDLAATDLSQDPDPVPKEEWPFPESAHEDAKPTVTTKRRRRVAAAAGDAPATH